MLQLNWKPQSCGFVDMPNLPDLILPKVKYWGLAIERTSLRGVELSSQGNITRSAEVIIPDTILSNGQLTDKDQFKKFVEQLVIQGKFSSPYVAVTYSESLAFSREFTMPLLPQEEIADAVSWHVKDLFPFPPSDIYFDWRILAKRDHEYNVVVVAIQKYILDGFVSALIDAKLKPLRFEPDASALSRLLTLAHDTIALLVEIGKKGAYVTLVQGEKALFTTVVNYTGEDTPATYLTNIDQTLLEIVGFYKQKGIITDSTTQAILCGDLASGDWVKHVSDLLHYPTKLLSTKTNNPTLDKAYVSAATPIAPPDDDQSINVLPAGMQLYYDTERNISFYTVILTRVFVFTILTAIASLLTLIGIGLERGRAEREIKSVTSYISSQGTNTQNLLLLNAKAKTVVSLAPLRKTPRDELLTLSTLIPSEVLITHWEYEDAKLLYKVSGVAQRREDLLVFKEALDNSEAFTNVSLPLSTLEAKTNVNFIITFISKN